MTKRKSKAETEETFLRLARGLDVYRDWCIDLFHRHNPPGAQPDLNQITMPGSVYVDIFNETPAAGSALLKEIQAVYAGIARDIPHLLRETDATIYQAFLVRFKNETGFSFLQVAAIGSDLTKAVLNRAKILNEDEWYIVQDILNDMSQQILSADQISRLQELSQDFEGSKERPT